MSNNSRIRIAGRKTVSNFCAAGGQFTPKSSEYVHYSMGIRLLQGKIRPE
jgi:hypothetical protein